AMWFFEHFPLSSGVSYGISPRADGMVLMRELEEFIGKHFPDASGEEDCTKARPVKAAQVADFVRWLQPRLQEGTSLSDAANAPPAGLLKPAEELEASLLSFASERNSNKTEVSSRGALRRFFDGRFDLAVS
ncbi:unnamed protein product, partial [Polarella glacialis]